IMIGGSGERKTFRLAARYANHLNMIAGPTELPRKLEALAQRCEEVGRDRDEIETSVLLSVVIDDTPEAAAKVADDYTAAKGMSPEEAEALKARTIIGGPDQVAEQVQGVLATGVDGVIINAVVNGHVPGVVELAGKTLSPLIG
ncbi:MAG TPA: LLM class flavin-dependent oxidoreductase, partial [Microlunatus sp.]|nr:LLM class flavin-dependent oxidoreductase [Microlunatus sp.]